jgi:hypothetical protein
MSVRCRYIRRECSKWPWGPVEKRETREPFFDVIIEHGVTPEKTNYFRDDAAQIADMRKLGGLDLTSGPLPMA